MPVVAELPWHLLSFLPYELVLSVLPAMLVYRPTATVISYIVIRHKKKHATLTSSPAIPSQTSSPGEKAPQAAHINKFYRLGHWFKNIGKDIPHFWKLMWGDKKEGEKWTKDIQYPRPGDVLFYPLRPDLNPYLDPSDPAQPQISGEREREFQEAAVKMYRFEGKGQKVGKVPKRERIKYDSWKRRDTCSGRNLIWHYLAVGDGSVPEGLEKCPGYIRLLMDHGCAITINGTTCLGSHPTEDLNLIRYAYPNGTWLGMGDPLKHRVANLTISMENSTEMTDMYMIDTGNGTVINVGINRSVMNETLNVTALAEGKLPDGVELYGEGWKSEYDLDDEDGDASTFGKRTTKPSLIGGAIKRYGDFDLSRHLIPSANASRILKDLSYQQQDISISRGSYFSSTAIPEFDYLTRVLAILFVVNFVMSIAAFYRLQKNENRRRRRAGCLGPSRVDGDVSSVESSAFQEMSDSQVDHLTGDQREVREMVQLCMSQICYPGHYV